METTNPPHFHVTATFVICSRGNSPVARHSQRSIYTACAVVNNLISNDWHFDWVSPDQSALKCPSFLPLLCRLMLDCLRGPRGWAAAPLAAGRALVERRAAAAVLLVLRARRPPSLNRPPLGCWHKIGLWQTNKQTLCGSGSGIYGPICSKINMAANLTADRIF